MKFDKDAEILGTALTSLIERKGGICLTDEDFALYLEGRLNAERSRAIISHLVSCRDCRERLTIPLPQFDVVRETTSKEGLLSFLWRPVVLAPVAALFVALLSITLNLYLKPQDSTEERLRGANLVALKQLDITSGLLAIIREGNEDELKNELIKGLPPGKKVTSVIIEDMERIRESKEGDKITLILYSDGSLKVKPGD